jgi:hypothetical protein
MFTPLNLAIALSVTAAFFIVTVKAARNARAARSIAQVLHDTENPAERGWCARGGSRMAGGIRTAS